MTDTDELRRLAEKPWRGACTECRDQLWFADTAEEAWRLVREHAETHLRVWAHAAPPQPADPAPARTEINNTAASTERRWAPHVTAPATPFGFTSATGPTGAASDQPPPQPATPPAPAPPPPGQGP